MLIADGHHRYGISRTYRDEVRAATGRTDTAAEETLTFVSELVADQLSVAAIHRLYDRMYSEFSRTFTLTEMERPTPQTLAAMQAEGFLVLYTRDRTYRLDPVPGAFEGVRSLDGAWLEHTLGEVPVTYQHGLTETLAAVDAGRRRGGGPDPAGQRRRDRADRPGGTVDAAQVDLLHPQAQDRLRAAAAVLRRSPGAPPALASLGWLTGSHRASDRRLKRELPVALSPDDVAALARLARIELTDEELAHLAPQLDVILESVASGDRCRRRRHPADLARPAADQRVP